MWVAYDVSRTASIPPIRWTCIVHIPRLMQGFWKNSHIKLLEHFEYSKQITTTIGMCFLSTDKHIDMSKPMKAYTDSTAPRSCMPFQALIICVCPENLEAESTPPELPAVFAHVKLLKGKNALLSCISTGSIVLNT